MDDREFKHIKNNSQFPGLPTEIKYVNEFDYTKGKEGCIIKLCNVKWNSDYSNVVDFESEEARDKYFDSLIDEHITLPSEQVLMPSGEIKLPFTFTTATRFNYLEVIFPDMPVEEDYSFHRKKFFYFIRDIRQLSASATEFYLKLDAGTTFIYSCEINYMVLQRGHAPLYASKVDDYLSNPLKNSKYLLAEDFNVENTDLVPYQKIETLNDKDMYICFAIKGDIKGTWGTEKEDSGQIPQKSCGVNEGVPNNICMYALQPKDYVAFMDYVYNNVKQWYRTLDAIFLIPGKLIELKNSFTIAGITCYELDSNQTHIMDFKLTKENFDYPDNYKELTKLYTFPYAYLEIANEEGQSHLIKIENTTNNIKAMSTLNIAYPFLKLDIMFNGIGSDKEYNTAFVNLDEKSFVFGGKGADYLLEYDIPTYAVNPNVYSEWELDNYGDIQDMLMTAEVVYANDCDYANMLNSNEYRSADTDNINSNNEGNNVYNNANIEANLIVNNNASSVLCTSRQLEYGINYQNDMREDLNNKQELDYEAASNVVIWTTNEEIEAKESQATCGAIGSVGSSAIAGAMIGGGAGAIAGALLALPQATVDLVNTMTQTNCMRKVADIQVQGSRHQTSNSQGFNSISTEFGNVLATNQTNAGIENANTIAGNSSSAKRGIGSNTSSTIKTNASNLCGTRKTNSSAKCSTSLNNAKRTYDLAFKKAHYKDESGQIEAPRQYGQYSGSKTNAIKPMSISYNLITKSQSAIKEIGDIFCRYGYMLNQNGDFEKFNLMKYFTYGKVEDIGIIGKDKNMNDKFRNEIIAILKQGTTIGANPDKIGGVSIYDNI